MLLADDGGRLSDLGLAQVLEPGQTVTGLGPIGSVEYLDPAILRGERGSRASDIWSLGVTLHRAVSGVGVYGEIPERDPLVAVRRVLTTTPSLSPELDERLAALVRRCLDPDPAARPRTVLEFAESLDQQSASKQPVAHRPASGPPSPQCDYRAPRTQEPLNSNVDEILAEAFRHNAWATKRLLAACRDLTPAQHTAPTS